MLRRWKAIVLVGGGLLALLPLLSGCEWSWDSGPDLVAAFTYEPTSGDAPLTVHFDASPSTGATQYFWDFGDGEAAIGKVVEHTYLVPGQYTVTLTVSDDTGATATATALVVVTGNPVYLEIEGIEIEPVGPLPPWCPDLPENYFPEGMPLLFTLRYTDLNPEDAVDIYVVYWRVDRIDPATPFYDSGEGNPWWSNPPYVGGACGEEEPRPFTYRVYVKAFDTAGNVYRLTQDFYIVSQRWCEEHR